MQRTVSILIIMIFVIGAVLVPIRPVSSEPTFRPLEDGSDDKEFIDGFPIWEELAAKRSTGSRYLAATGEHAYIYVDGGNPTQEQIDALLEEFDYTIWPADTEIFGGIPKDKISIHLDTIDGPYGIGGYYIPGTYDIWIDSADLNIWGYEICAHEFQHLIHDKHDNNEELWLNEGMSDLAIHMIYGPEAMSVSGHLGAFEDNPDNDLTVFENKMYDYGSAYAFAVYLWEHFGGNDTIRDIVDNDGNGFNGVLNVLRDKDPDWDYSPIELFSIWSVANILDDPKVYDGLYGYEEIDLSMYLEDVFDSYPASHQGFVESWGNDYYSFRNGDKRDLVLEVARMEGSFNFSLIGIGSAGVLVRHYQITTNDPSGEILIPKLGSSYMLAYLAVSGWEGERYRFVAELKDSTPPETTIVVNPSKPNGLDGYYITKPNIGFVISETASTYFWWDDGEEIQYCQQCEPPIVPIAPEGVHTLNFYSVDNDANQEDPPKDHSFKVDTIRPETMAVLDPLTPNGETGWYNTNVTITLECDEEASIYYRWDSGFYHNYTGPMAAEEGSHSIYHYGVDIAGNEGDVHFIDVKVDTISPSVTAEVYPQVPDGINGWYITQPTFAITIDETNARAYYRIDDQTSLVYTSPFKVPQGERTVHYWARDQAGNQAEVLSWSFKVDTISPTTTIVVDPAVPDGKNGWYVTVPSIDLLVASDADIYYKWDEGAERRFTGSLSLDEGDHVLYYWSKDKAGNVEKENVLNIKLDTEEPDTEYRISGSEGFGWYLEAPIIFLEPDADAEAYYRWDSTVDTKFTMSIIGRDGIHDLSFYSLDEAGNMGPTTTITLNVDSLDPSPYFIVSPMYSFQGEEVMVDASDSTDNIGIAMYEVDFGDGASDSSVNDPVFVHSYLLHGSFTVTLTVIDEAGREAVFSKEVYVEKRLKEDGDKNFLEENPMLLLMLLLVAAIGILGAAVSISRHKRRKALLRYVRLYEAQMAEKRRRQARARKGKGSRKKVAKKVVKKVVKRKRRKRKGR